MPQLLCSVWRRGCSYFEALFVRVRYCSKPFEFFRFPKWLECASGGRDGRFSFTARMGFGISKRTSLFIPKLAATFKSFFYCSSCSVGVRWSLADIFHLFFYRARVDAFRSSSRPVPAILALLRIDPEV